MLSRRFVLGAVLVLAWSLALASTSGQARAAEPPCSGIPGAEFLSGSYCRVVGWGRDQCAATGKCFKQRDTDNKTNKQVCEFYWPCDPAVGPKKSSADAGKKSRVERVRTAPKVAIEVFGFGKCVSDPQRKCRFDGRYCAVAERNQYGTDSWNYLPNDDDCRPDAVRDFADVCRIYRDKGFDTANCSGSGNSASSEPASKPGSTSDGGRKSCPQYVQDLASGALKKEDTETRAFQAKCAYEAVPKDCRPFLADYAREKAISFSGDYLEFAMAVARFEFADLRKQWDTEANRCDAEIREFILLAPFLRGMADADERYGTDMSNTPSVREARVKYGSLGRSIGGSIPCLDMCREQGTCISACIGDGYCAKEFGAETTRRIEAARQDRTCPAPAAERRADLAESVVVLVNGTCTAVERKDVPPGATVLEAAAQVRDRCPDRRLEGEPDKKPEGESDKKRESEEAAPRTPRATETDVAARKQEQCPSGFSLMTRVLYEWCGAYDLSDADCRNAGGGNVRERTDAVLGMRQDARPGGWRNLCLLPPLPAAAPGDPERRAPGTPIPSLADLGIPPLNQAPQLLKNAPNDARALAACRQLQSLRDKCKREWDFYRGEGRLEQDAAPRFKECYELYDGKTKECYALIGLLPPPSAQPAKAAPPAAPPQPAKAAAPDKGTPGQSRPPPKAQAAAPQPPAMSPRCEKLVGDYVAAARANDGPGALSAYNALKRAGGCNVLNKVDRPLPTAKKPMPNADKFISRGDTPLTDQVVGACDASPAECAARVRQLQQGTSPEAKAALTMHAINVGLSLGNMMAQGMIAVPRGNAAMPRGTNTDMRSLATRPIRSAPGQGAPAGPVQRNIQSDIRLQ